MQSENLFQVFSQVFVESQQAFNKCELELRSKCRTLSEKLKKVSEDLEKDSFTAGLEVFITIEEEILFLMRNAKELEDRRTHIKESIDALKSSTKSKVTGVR